MSSANISIYLSGVQEITTILPPNEAWQNLHSAMLIPLQIQHYLLSNISSNKTHIHYVIKPMCLSERLLLLRLRFSKKLQITSLIRCESQMADFLSKGSKTRLKERDETTHPALNLMCKKSWIREPCAKFSFKLIFLLFFWKKLFITTLG